MNKKILYLFVFIIFFFAASNYSKAQTPDGDYKVGDTKCTIKQDIQGNWRVFWDDTTDGSSSLKYKENMVTGEQVWIERRKGKVVGNFILNNNYTSGRYVRFSDDAKLSVVKLQ